MMLAWWQVAYIIFTGLVLFHISMLVFVIPDSPHAYVERGESQKAKAILRKVVLNPGHVIDELLATKHFVRIDPESTQGIKIALSKL